MGGKSTSPPAFPPCSGGEQAPGGDQGRTLVETIEQAFARDDGGFTRARSFFTEMETSAVAWTSRGSTGRQEKALPLTDSNLDQSRIAQRSRRGARRAQLKDGRCASTSAASGPVNRRPNGLLLFSWAVPVPCRRSVPAPRGGSLSYAGTWRVLCGASG